MPVGLAGALGGGGTDAACGCDEPKDGNEEPEHPAASGRTASDAASIVIRRHGARSPPRPPNTARPENPCIPMAHL